MIAILVALLLTGPTALFAQPGTEGSILGVVQDASGGTVAGAPVTTTNTDTGFTKSTTTDEHGYFQIVALPLGTYSVRVAANGFTTWEVKGLTLIAGEQKRVQPTLTVGDVKQQVTIQAFAPVVQTERASVEMAIEEKQIRDLPLNGRVAVQMVQLVPGMRYLGLGAGGSANVGGVEVQGMGSHSDATQFAVDGISANDPSTEAGMAFPNLEAVDQFRVQTNSFSAENGRDPVQLTMVTKSGTNQYHGTAWDFLRNDVLDARNTFLAAKPYLRRNQYGFSAGGPIVKNRTFFFTSFEGLKVRGQGGYNSQTIPSAFLNGDFSSLKTAVTDPTTGTAFPGNQIPTARFSAASKFFFPYILLPNHTGNLFQALAPQPEDGTNYTLRLDQLISARQKISGRWIRVGDTQSTTGYRPDVVTTNVLVQHNAAVNYDFTVTPWMLLTLCTGFVHSNYQGNDPQVGQQNLTDQAGIQGFPTALRANAIGLPTVAFTGYTGFSWPVQVPSLFKREVLSGRTALNIIRGKHTLVIGGEYLDNRTGTAHASTNPRGSFTFNGQYTGNGFADYLLGLVQTASANVPLALFGVAHSPYSAIYADETFRVSRNVTINAGVRWDYWWQKAFVRGAGTTFDPANGKAVAGQNASGQVDLTAQPVAPFYGAATSSLWITAKQAGIPNGLFDASGYVSPRLGVAWRPLGKDSLVVRAGYGIFASSYFGNATGSSIIGPPYWANQNITFAKASNQRWETAFPANPADFVAPSIAAAVYNIAPMKIHEFNFSVQQIIPVIEAAATVSYVGSRGFDLTYFNHINTPPPGTYANLQASSPYPQFGTINLYESGGKEWYNSLQLKLERRFSHGLTYLLSYAFARDISLYGSETTAVPTLYAPPHYDEGISPNERRHILTASGIYEIPFGRGRKFGAHIPRAVDLAAGGWQLSAIYSFVSGPPLTLVVGGATLGNGVNARPNIVGDPNLANPSAAQWFNPAAFTAPAAHLFGTSAPGVVTGPASHVLSTGLMKNFNFTESKYLQFRWEMFNALNEVNLGTPVTTIGLATTGSITSAADPRQMQLALKFVF